MAAPSRSRAAARLALLGAVVIGALLLARHVGWLDMEQASVLVAQMRELRTHPAAAPLFVVGYVLATVLALPGLVLTLTGGAVFGFGTGFLLNWLGAFIGATGAYLLARRIGSGSVATLLGARASTLRRVADTHGFGGVLRLRLVPIIPFNILNYGAALAGVRLKHYLLATALGIIPATAVYTWFADALVAGAAGAQRDAFLRAAVGGALLVLLSFVPAIARRLGYLPPKSAPPDPERAATTP